MGQPLKSKPDPSKPNLSATEVLRAQLDDDRFETDYAQLAACFSGQDGGGLSPDLSNELAFEIVLNEVVEQACLTTGATGAAIVLQRNGEMVCRASNGSTAPELGSRLDEASGLSGECIRTRQTQRCDDAWADSRVDLSASQRLGVRSVMIMPLLRGSELAGLFELFSSQPLAFGERDKLTLGALAARILSNLEHSTEPLPPPNEPKPVWSNLEHVAEPVPPQNAPKPVRSNLEHAVQPPDEATPVWSNLEHVAEPLPAENEPNPWRRLEHLAEPLPPQNEPVPVWSNVPEPLPMQEKPIPFWGNLEHAAEPVPPRNEPKPVWSDPEHVAEPLLPQSEPMPISVIHESIPEVPEENSPGRGLDLATWALTAAVLACAILLGALLGRHLRTPRAMVRRHPIVSISATENASSAIRPSLNPSPSTKPEGANAAKEQPTSAKGNQKPAPPGSLLVFENGKEIFRMPPVQNPPAHNQLAQNEPEASSPVQGSGVQSASSVEAEKVVELSPATAEDNLLHRVEPQYPAVARQQRIQGAVVLEVHIARDGAVQQVQVLSGPPQLAHASTDAVKQWRFRPRRVNGRPAEMQTRITLNFRLPQ
jgi:TonB family protein